MFLNNDKFFSLTPTKPKPKGSNLAQYNPIRLKLLGSYTYSKYHHILMMNEFKEKNLIDIRLEDYEIGNKPSTISVVSTNLLNAPPLKKDQFSQNSFFPELKINQQTTMTQPNNFGSSFGTTSSFLKPSSGNIFGGTNIASTQNIPQMTQNNNPPQLTTTNLFSTQPNTNSSSFLNPFQQKTEETFTNPFSVNNFSSTTQQKSDIFPSISNTQNFTSQPNFGMGNLQNTQNLTGSNTMQNIGNNQGFGSNLGSTTGIGQGIGQTFSGNTFTKPTETFNINPFSTTQMQTDLFQKPQPFQTTQQTFMNNENPPKINDPFLIGDIKIENVPQRKITEILNQPEKIFEDEEKIYEEDTGINLNVTENWKKPIMDERLKIKTIPELNELKKRNKVKNLIINVDEFVEITYLEEIETKNLNSINIKYDFPDIKMLDKPGNGLNKRARVKLKKCWPISKRNGVVYQIKDEIDKCTVDRFLYELYKQFGNDFLEYNLEKGELLYEQKEFKSLI